MDGITNVLYWLFSPVWLAILLVYLAIRWMVTYHPPGRRQS